PRRKLYETAVRAIPGRTAWHRSAGYAGPPDGHDGQDHRDGARSRRHHCAHPSARPAEMIRALVLLIAAAGTAGATGPAPNDFLKPSAPTTADFVLNSSCPPGFEKTDAGVC